MATNADVEAALVTILAAAIYPSGTGSPSAAGFKVKVHRGWPKVAELNKAIMGDPTKGIPAAGRVTVNRGRMSRDVTRYGREWRVLSQTDAGIAVTVTGPVVTFSGTASGSGNAGATVGGVGYVAPIQAGDTAAVVAANLAAAIVAPGLAQATASGGSVTITPPAGGSPTIRAVVGGSGLSVREEGRANQGFLVTVFAATIEARDALEALVFSALDWVDRLVLPGGFSEPIRYVGATSDDAAERADLYRSDMIWSIEVPRVSTVTSAEMVFGAGTITAGSVRVGFGVLELPTPMVVPPIGAIRFDAWYDPANTIDAQCAAALSPAAWNARLPPNSAVSAGVASWPRATQATMDAEIVAAKAAGLSFWAFDSYAPADTLSLALQLYLSSTLRASLNFAMLGQSSNWADTTSADGYSAAFHRDISMMTQAGYQKVLGGRPLYFVLDASAGQLASLPAGGISSAIALLRKKAQLSGALNPYVVYLSGAPAAQFDNTTAAIQAGADAAGSYCNATLNGSEQPFSALASCAETDWSQRASKSLPMIPTAMTGWDQRPLIQTPQPFYPIGDYLSMSNFYDTATPAEIGAHVVDLARWINANPAACPAQAGLVYAWNELAEGGWLMPTYADSGPDASRCTVTGAALLAAVAASAVPTIPLIP